MRIYINMNTITIYLQTKFHDNWPISLGDIKKKLQNGIFGNIDKSTQSRTIKIYMDFHITLKYIPRKFHFNWQENMGFTASICCSHSRGKCTFGDMSKNIVSMNLKIKLEFV